MHDEVDASASDRACATTAIVIPARHASSRYPGKPLVAIRGADGEARTLIERSHAAALGVTKDVQVLVATDDERIARTVRDFGGDVLMTPTSCANGTERIAACLDRLPQADLLVNFQGDALLTPPQYVDALIAHMEMHPEAALGTVAVRCSADTYRHLALDAAQGQVGGTTVVLDAHDHALYFSKRILPYLAPDEAPGEHNPVLLHIGLYAYRREALERYVAAGPCMLEMAEGLEQLRFLYNGVPISVLVMPPPEFAMVEVNNPSDVVVVEGIMSRHGLS